MPSAAAALLVVALLWKSAPAVEKLHGSVARAGDGTLTAKTVSRIRVGDGVIVTMDAGTVVRPLSDQRLALQAGRVFLQVSRQRQGFVVETLR